MLANTFLKELGIDAAGEIFEFSEVFGEEVADKVVVTDAGITTMAGGRAGAGATLMSEAMVVEIPGSVAQMETGQSATVGLGAASASPTLNLAQGGQKGKRSDDRVFLNRARALQTSLDEDMVMPTRELEKRLRKHAEVDFSGVMAILEGLTEWRDEGKELGVLGTVVLRALAARGEMVEEGKGEEENVEMSQPGEEEEMKEWEDDEDDEDDEDIEDNEDVEDDDDSGDFSINAHTTRTLPAFSTIHISPTWNAAPALPTKLEHKPFLWQRVRRQPLHDLQKQLYIQLCMRGEMQRVFRDMTRTVKNIGYVKRKTQKGQQKMERNMKEAARTGVMRIRELVQMNLPS